MSSLNYNHLYYFYRVALDGGVTAASRNLHLTPQTVSGQISSLEQQIGFPLFERAGKKMVLTRRGLMVFGYAEDIFHLGDELKGMLKQPEFTERLAVSIGVLDVIPKTLAYTLIKPLMALPSAVKLTCREGDLNYLLAELALNKLDLVLSDRPIPPGSRLRVYNHPLVETEIALFATESNAQKYREGFPSSLQGAPFLMPNVQTMLNQILLGWFDQIDVHPMVIAEFDDSALAKAFAQAGLGILAAPWVIHNELQQQFGLHSIGLLANVKMQFYGISPHKKIKHPGVMAILDESRSWEQASKS